MPFGKLPMLHFASFVVLHAPVQADDDKPLPVLPDQLVFESCIDGPFEEYADALLHVGAGALHDIFSCCVDYTLPSADEACDEDGDEQRLTDRTCGSHWRAEQYLREKRRKPHLLHIGSPGLRVDHIKAGARLRQQLDRELDAVVARGRATERPLDLMRSLRDRLNVPPSSRGHWFLGEPSPEQVDSKRFPWFADQQSHFASRLRHWGLFLTLSALALVVAGSLIIAAWRLDGARGVLLAAVAVMVGMYLFWRWLTRGKPLTPETSAQKAKVRAIRELEDEGVQNKMASLVILKDGWLTTFVTRAVLFFFNTLYRTVFTD